MTNLVTLLYLFIMNPALPPLALTSKTGEATYQVARKCMLCHRRVSQWLAPKISRYLEFIILREPSRDLRSAVVSHLVQNSVSGEIP